MAEAEQTDKEEDRRYGRGEELPAELARRDERLKRIVAAKRELSNGRRPRNAVTRTISPGPGAHQAAVQTQARKPMRNITSPIRSRGS